MKNVDSILISSIAAGQTVIESASSADVCERTVYRRLAVPDFQVELPQARAESDQAATTAARSAGGSRHHVGCGFAVFGMASSLVLFASAAFAASPPVAESPNLCVLTYNVQFLPGLVSYQNERRRPLYRAEEIGRRLAEYDLIGLNEVFDDRPRERLLAAIKKSWGGDQFFVVTGPIPTDGRLNGGLAVVSRFPFVATHSMIYRVASSPLEYGLQADGWVAKGVLHARILRRGDQPEGSKEAMLDVFATHLEARVAKLRHQQIREFAAFVGKHASRDDPIIMLGDFNTRGNPKYRAETSSPYRQLIAAIGGALPDHRVADLWPALKPEGDGGTSEQEGESGGKRIDYIFLATPKRDLDRIQPTDVRVNRFLDQRVIALSDHSGVEADFIWRTESKE